MEVNVLMILTTEVYREFLKLMKKRTGDTYTREEYDNFTELKYAYDLCCILGGGRWEVKKDLGEEIILRPGVMLSKEDRAFYKKLPLVLRFPNSITKEGLSSIISISGSIKERYPKLTEEFVAAQLIKNFDRCMMIPLRGIHILSGDDWKEHEGRVPEDVIGFAYQGNGEVYVNFDCDEPVSLWALLCHEIRHIGLDCNPVYRSCAEEERKEKSVYNYGVSAALYHDWDDSWMEGGWRPEHSEEEKETEEKTS